MTRVRVRVMPKASVLDPQGGAVQRSLASLGHVATDVRVGRVVELTVDAGPDAAVEQVEAMCRELLGNAVIEQWSVEAVGELVAT